MTSPRSAALHELIAREQGEFARLHPGSLRAYYEGQEHFLYGAPSHWMRRWAGGFPLYCQERARRAFRMCGRLALRGFLSRRQRCNVRSRASGRDEGRGGSARAGATLMLPTEEATWVGAELAQRFGLPYWGFTTSASDANRAVIRIARMITGRHQDPRVQRLLSRFGRGSPRGAARKAVVMRNGIHREWRRSLQGIAHRRVQRYRRTGSGPGPARCRVVLAEPFMTNFGMIAPQPGYLDAMREITRRSGTLLIIDETHTFVERTGGYTAARPRTRSVRDRQVGRRGYSGGSVRNQRGVAERMWREVPKVNPATVRQSAHLGFGGTLAGSALQVAAVRAVLERVLTRKLSRPCPRPRSALARGCGRVISRQRLPWSVVQIGARVEMMSRPGSPCNAPSRRGRDGTLEALLHIYFMNRGVLVTPFHCMMLMCPATTDQDARRFLAVLDDFRDEITRLRPHGTAGEAVSPRWTRGADHGCEAGNPVRSPLFAEAGAEVVLANRTGRWQSSLNGRRTESGGRAQVIVLRGRGGIAAHGASRAGGGALDILVHNAGGCRWSPAEKIVRDPRGSAEPESEVLLLADPSRAALAQTTRGRPSGDHLLGDRTARCHDPCLSLCRRQGRRQRLRQGRGSGGWRPRGSPSTAWSRGSSRKIVDGLSGPIRARESSITFRSAGR